MNKFATKEKITQINKQKENVLDEKSNISLNKILGTDACQSIIEECREFRERVYTPLKTIFMFAKQVMSPDKSCRNAIAGAVAEQVGCGEQAMSTNTGPYCKARQRLPEETLHKLVRETGSAAVNAAPSLWNWHGRAVKLVDGTTLTMADTKENRTEFFQHGNQQDGVGFPMVRMVAVMSLASGTVIDYAIAAHKGKSTGEHSLLRSILDCINAGDVLLGDRYFPSFF